MQRCSPTDMLAAERPIPGPGGGPPEDRVESAYRALIAEREPAEVRLLYDLLRSKYCRIQRLAGVGGPPLEPTVDDLLADLLPGQALREAALADNPPELWVDLVRTVGSASFRPGQLSVLAARIRGVPEGTAQDLAAELAHGAAPDRFGLWTRWVWNPQRGTGALRGLVSDPPADVEQLQVELGRIRFALARLGASSSTFAYVDLLLAFELERAMDRFVRGAFRGGGIESLLPAGGDTAAMILRVRGGYLRARR